MRVLLRTHADIAKATAYLNALPLGKRCYVFDVSVWRAQRSVRQNRLLHMWIGLIAQETGNDADTVKEYVKGKFLGRRRVTVGGDSVDVLPSTASLDTKEMTTLLDAVRQWAGEELGCVLPLPDDLGWDDFVLRYGT